GSLALTSTLGGTTSGYSLTGSSGMLISPTTKMMIDSTEAKIGLSTKKREKFTAAASRNAPCRRVRNQWGSVVGAGWAPGSGGGGAHHRAGFALHADQLEVG